MYVEVVVNLPPIRGAFHYHLPPELRGSVRPGHLVTAPFGRRRVQGLVVGAPDAPEVPETRPIEGLVDPDPVLTPAQLKLARWIAHETHSTLIDCLTLMLPPGLSQRADSLYRLEKTDIPDRPPLQQRLIKLLAKRGPLRGRQIAKAMGKANWRRAIDSLVRAGILSRISVLDQPTISPRTVRTARLAQPPDLVRQHFDDLGRPGGSAAMRRRRILETLIEEREPLEVAWIYAETGGNSQDLRYLEARDLIALGGAEIWRDPLADLDYVPSEPPALTMDQMRAWEPIQSALRGGGDAEKSAFLLHGVTGSGKTEIYLRAAGEALSLGKGALVLVPEIALTPQTVRRFLARFPGRVGVLHSQLSKGERYDTWRRVRVGQLRLIVGPRSALFAPMAEIALIAVDESHDESYKEQGSAPRYHARQAALAYAEILGAVCVLGSATPDVVTTHRAERGQLIRLNLPQRILGHRDRIKRQAARLQVRSRFRPAEGSAEYIDLPPVRIVDMRQELRAGNRSLFSRALQKALAESLSAHQQVILFLNRRGTSTYVFCRDCGHSLRCSRCDSTLTYHGQSDRLQCHHCGAQRRSPRTCPNCGSDRIKHFGAGTQRIQAEVDRLYPQVRTLRWDRDTTRTKGAHDAILSHFSDHRADVLIGTQMVAKGLDLPLVTLVGVISADIGLNLPDYRAAERTFQVLSQVSGRAGRGLLGGQVILQTFQPDHYAIQAAAAHDYQAFYQAELRQRRDLGYPPYRRLARLICHHLSEDAAREQAERLAERLRESAQGLQADLIGPVPAFYQRLRGEYRWMIVIRAADPLSLIPEDLSRDWIVDIDPVSLL